MSVQLDLSRTVARLQRANIPLGKQLDVQVIPVAAPRGSSLEFKNAERVKIVRK
jgi:hypothetical protein